MSESLKIELPPEALKALEKDGVVVIPKKAHPSVKRAVWDSLVYMVFGERGKPTFRYRCLLHSSHMALNIGRRR